MFNGPPEPDIPSAVGLLQHLTQDELKDLLNNDNKLSEMVDDMIQVRKIA